MVRKNSTTDGPMRDMEQPRSATMSDLEIKRHWQTWAQEYGSSLRATTKRPSAKQLEIDALARHLRKIGGLEGKLDVLEVGCGNCHNLLALAEIFPQAQLTGVDYVPEMIAAAKESLRRLPANTAVRIRPYVGDILDLSATEGELRQYDVVFTDRCLINLNTVEKQCAAIDQLRQKLKSNGILILVENSIQTYESQNDCREILGLHRRVPERFNLFIDEEKILPYLNRWFCNIDIEDFITFHDLVLYVLTPIICNGKVDHNHPLVEAATKINLAISQTRPSAFGAFGQNRLYHCSGHTIDKRK